MCGTWVSRSTYVRGTALTLDAYYKYPKSARYNVKKIMMRTSCSSDFTRPRICRRWGHLRTPRTAQNRAGCMIPASGRANTSLHHRTSSQHTTPDILGEDSIGIHLAFDCPRQNTIQGMPARRVAKGPAAQRLLLTLLPWRVRRSCGQGRDCAKTPRSTPHIGRQTAPILLGWSATQIGHHE